MNPLITAYERTDEQKNIVNAVLQSTNVPVIVEAGSGTGKTTLLLDVAHILSKNNARVLYLVFGKQNAEQAKAKFPRNTLSKTVNSIAFHYMRIKESRRKISRLYPSHLKQVLNINTVNLNIGENALYGIILKGLSNFCDSSDRDVSESHFQFIHGGREGLTETVVHHTRRLFNLIRPEVNNCEAPLPHNVYLKAWELQGAPGISDFDLVMVDECQDSNPVTISILRHAKSLLLVGDESQSIFGFRGAVSAMRQFDGIRLPLSLSFRFGPEIAELANKIIEKKHGYKGIVKLRGMPSINTRIHKLLPGQKHTRIFRTNQDLIFAARFLTDQELPINITGDMSDIANKLESAWNLKEGENRSRIRHPLVSPFHSWRDFSDKAESSPRSEAEQIFRIIEENDRRTPDVISILREKWCQEHSKINLVSGHRSKGMEFNEVVISSDFDRYLGNAGRDQFDEEMNLLYVATTRVMRTLEIKCEFLNSLL
jgi:superfamily I DNA/RNA helicase